VEAHSRQIFAHQLCEQERAEEVEKVLDKGMESSGGVLALRVDRGTPYLAELTCESVEDRGAEMRVARAYQATDKAILERWFLTAKEALHDVLGCVDLREGPGDLSWRKKLAQTIAAAVIALYMRWCYPYIPQPHIDGRTPEERTQDRPDGSIDAIRRALDDQVRHNENKKAVARELHDQYGFRWSLKHWLKAVEEFSAEDLREAARRFDHILLRRCFQCNSRRNPKYLLAIIRTVARARRERRVIGLNIQEQLAKSDAERQSAIEEERICIQNPQVALQHALDIAVAAFESGGFGLAQAQRRLDQALSGFSKVGADAYRLSTDRIITLAPNNAVRSWLFENIELFRPPSSLLREDLQV